MLMWWKSAVNLRLFLSLATFRMRSNACDTLTRLCARHVLCWSTFPLVSALGSPGSAAVASPADCSTAVCTALFAGFAATMTESDFSCPYIIGHGSSPSRSGRYSLLGPGLHRQDRTSFAWRTHSITSSARTSNEGGIATPRL